jgi:hypothetical protein
MAFPIDTLPQKTEIFVDGGWLDLTALGRIRNDADVVITRGRANEQASLSPSTCACTINNRDGLLSNRNPNSIYYGKLRRNIPFRHSITESVPWLRLPQWLRYANESGTTQFIEVRDAGSVSTTDKAVLDITGDLDIRLEIEPDDWITGTTNGQIVASKYDNITGNQRSWILYLSSAGELAFRWSENGTNVIGDTFSDPLAPLGDRVAIRITLDVDDGGVYRVRYYTSDSINGTWTQYGPSWAGPSTTSVFASTAALVLGKQTVSDLGGFTGIYPYAGKIHGFQLRNGINGTLVANMDPTGRTPGDTSWSDGLATPNTWTVNLTAEITQSDYRFHGELAQLPQKWDSTGTDVYVPVVASGIHRRLTQGPAILNSALRRHLEALDNVGYWTVEDASQATSLANVTPGGRAGTVTDVTLGPASDFPASAGVARINSSSTRMRTVAMPATAGSGVTWVLFYFKLPAVPANDTTIAEFITTGTSRLIRLEVRSAGTAFFTSVFDADGTSLATANTTMGSTSINGQWVMWQYRIVDTGAGFDVTGRWRNLGGVSSTHTAPVATGSVGVAKEWRTGGDADLADAEFGHVMMGNDSYSTNNYGLIKAESAFTGEEAATRWLRLLREHNIDGYCIGDPFATEPMGPQTLDTLPNLLQECVDVDRGQWFEPRDQLGYLYRTRLALYQQEGPQIDYAAGELSGVLDPVDDDQLTRNDVIVRRPGGSEGRVVKTEGPNNVNDPTDDPDGIGRYDVALQKNAQLDSRLNNLAGHEVYLGTWDELRYPTVQVEFARPVFLTTAGLAKAGRLARLDVGDRVDLTGLPAWLPPDDVPLLIQGYQEVHRNRGREFRWNTSPYGPYLHASWLPLVDDVDQFRAAAVASYLDAGIDENDLTMSVRTDRGPFWGTTAGKPQNFPLPVKVGGEVMIIDGIAAAVGDTQAFTIDQRSVNGVVKAHDAETFVQVLKDFYAQL